MKVNDIVTKLFYGGFFSLFTQKRSGDISIYVFENNKI